YAYDPYGAASVLTPDWAARGASLYAWRDLFQGIRLDPATGLYYYRNREYSPTLGRFLQNDPLGFGGGDPNLYRAEGNDPAGSVDPAGLYEWPWSKNARWRWEGSLIGDVVDAPLEGLRKAGDVVRAAQFGV